MEFNANIYNAIDVVIIMIYLFVILYKSNLYKGGDFRVQYLALAIGIMHLIMSIIFTLYSLNTPADARGYYVKSRTTDVWDEFGVGDGTNFISQLVFPFSNFLDISYLSCNLIFSMISLAGLYRFYDVVLGAVKKWTNWMLLLLLPSMHFWTGFIGKDAIVFFGITSIVNNMFFRKSFIYYIFPVLLIILSRLYIAVFLGVGLLLSIVLLSGKIKLYAKVLVGGLGLAAIVVLSPYFFNVVGVGDVSNIENRREKILQANLEGGGGIDLSNSSLAIRFVSYLFRPFIFEAHSITSFMAAIENILWMLIFYLILKNFRFLSFRQSTLFWFSFASFFTILLPASYILSNLGIAARQKIMVLPMLLFVFYSLISRKFLFITHKKKRLS